MPPGVGDSCCFPGAATLSLMAAGDCTQTVVPPQLGTATDSSLAVPGCTHSDLAGLCCSCLPAVKAPSGLPACSSPLFDEVKMSTECTPPTAWLALTPCVLILVVAPRRRPLMRRVKVRAGGNSALRREKELEMLRVSQGPPFNLRTGRSVWN